MIICNANETLIFVIVIKAFENNILWALWNENFMSGFDNVISRIRRIYFPIIDIWNLKSLTLLCCDILIL